MHNDTPNPPVGGRATRELDAIRAVLTTSVDAPAEQIDHLAERLWWAQRRVTYLGGK